MRRVVFDTNCVLSALLYRSSSLAWLRSHWQSECLPLISGDTAGELLRVLRYAKFALSEQEIDAHLAEYLPFCSRVDRINPLPIVCRDPKDQRFLDLSYSAHADVLVTGDLDLLTLSGTTPFLIQTPAAYKIRTD